MKSELGTQGHTGRPSVQGQGVMGARHVPAFLGLLTGAHMASYFLRGKVPMVRKCGFAQQRLPKPWAPGARES